jgi:hypothetical protein
MYGVGHRSPTFSHHLKRHKGGKSLKPDSDNIPFSVYMEPICPVSRGKIGDVDTEKRAYRNTRDNATDAPAPLLRPSPATDHEAEKLEG